MAPSSLTYSNAILRRPEVLAIDLHVVPHVRDGLVGVISEVYCGGAEAASADQPREAAARAELQHAAPGDERIVRHQELGEEVAGLPDAQADVVVVGGHADPEGCRWREERVEVYLVTGEVRVILKSVAGRRHALQQRRGQHIGLYRGRRLLQALNVKLEDFEGVTRGWRRS